MKRMLLTTLMVLVFAAFGQAQTRSTNQTKVVFIVQQESKKVLSIHLLSSMAEKKDRLAQEYPNCRFFLGELRGQYELKQDVIFPQPASILTMYTEREVFVLQNNFPAKNLKAGDYLLLGQVTTEVLSKKEGEVVLKTLND